MGSGSANGSERLALRDSGVRVELRPEAPLQLLAQLGNLHPRHNDEFATQHFPRLVVVRQLTRNATILAILVPAEAPVGNRLRTNELETAQERIAFRHLKFLTENGDVHKLFVWTKGFRHDECCPPCTGQCEAADFPLASSP